VREREREREREKGETEGGRERERRGRERGRGRDRGREGEREEREREGQRERQREGGRERGEGEGERERGRRGREVYCAHVASVRYYHKTRGSALRKPRFIAGSQVPRNDKVQFMVKGPAADATDAPQPYGLLCDPVMKVRREMTRFVIVSK
jgi:hypothetical protein